MCVIVAKNKSDRLPTIDELKHCYTRNDDGAGFMYVNNNKVVIDKGYMTYDSFIKHYKKLCKRFNNFDNKCLVIHCRIGTAGTNTAQNTHPYPISNSIKKLHRTYTTATLGIAHNGIIRDYTPTASSNTQDTNDTQEFISTYLASLRRGYPRFYKDSNILDAIEYLTSSKFAILSANDELVTIGDFINHNELLFSNTSYEEYKPITYAYNYPTYYNSTYNYDDDDEWWRTSHYTPTTSASQSITHKIDYNSLIDVPSDYYVEYNDKAQKGDEEYYCIDTSQDTLYRFNEHIGDFEYITNDFTIYDDTMEPVNDWSVLWGL